MEKIALMGTHRKNAKWIKRNDYQKFYELILGELTPGSDMCLEDLIDKASEKLYSDFPLNFSWIFLQVKNDMEARGLIKTNLNFLRQQTIRIANEHTVNIL
jgi:hypothetical protein